MAIQDVAVIASSLTALAAVVIAPVVQLYLGNRQSAVARIAAEAARKDSESAGRYEVARFRQQWINTLRDLLAEQHSLLMTLEEKPFPIDSDRKLSALITKIELLLNPGEPESQRLLEVIDQMYDCEDLDRRVQMDADFVSASQAILKKEWVRVKAELCGKPTVALIGNQA